MIRQEEVYPIGRVGKAHGVGGEVTVQLTDTAFDDAGAEYLILGIDGLLVPFFMEEYRFRTDSTIIVKFEGVETQAAARALTGCEVWGRREWLGESAGAATLGPGLAGYEILDRATGSVVGRVADIDDTTANVLLVLDDGRLLPAALVSDIDEPGRRLTLDIPDGLLTL